MIGLDHRIANLFPGLKLPTSMLLGSIWLPFQLERVTRGDYNLLYVIWFLFKDDIAEKDLHNYFCKYA